MKDTFCYITKKGDGYEPLAALSHWLKQRGPAEHAGEDKVAPAASVIRFAQRPEGGISVLDPRLPTEPHPSGAP